MIMYVSHVCNTVQYYMAWRYCCVKFAVFVRIMGPFTLSRARGIPWSNRFGTLVLPPFPDARFWARERAPKSTILCTKENSKKHDLEHDVWTKERALHEGEYQKHDLWHEGEHQKARSRARFLARGRAPKSTILCTRESTKKHDFVHEGEHRKAQSRARFLRGNAPKSTILCTKENTHNNVRPK